MAKRRTNRLGRFLERSLFAVMGPPQVGDPGAPAGPPAAGPRELCPRCRGPRDDHEVVRGPRLTYTRCPADG